MNFIKNKKNILIFILLIILVICGIYSYYSITHFNSCSSAYTSLKQSELCTGKFEDYVGTNEVIDNIEWFDYVWGEDIGDYGIVKSEIGGPNEACYWQGYRQYIETGIRKDLVECFVNSVEIKSNDELLIQCGCLFG